MKKIRRCHFYMLLSILFMLIVCGTEAKAYKNEQIMSAQDITGIVSKDKYIAYPIDVICSGDTTLSYKSNNSKVVVNDPEWEGYAIVEPNFIGKAIITIYASETDEYYSAKKEISIIIKPREAKITSLKYSKNKILIKNSNDPGNVRYQFQYATNNKFNNSKTVSTVYYKSGYYIVDKPKNGTTYYFRVRGYKTVNDEIYYGKWSDTKKIKVEVIEQKEQKITAKNITKIVSSSDRTIALNAKTNGNGKLTYKSNSKNISVKNGKITIRKNYIGKATITITAAETNTYKKATKKINVTVNPQRAIINSLIYKKGKISVTIKKNIGNVNYEIQYKVGKNGKYITPVNANYIAYSKEYNLDVKKGNKGKKHYFRVRALKVINGTTYIGEWSKVKSVKTK